MLYFFRAFLLLLLSCCPQLAYGTEPAETMPPSYNDWEKSVSTKAQEEDMKISGLWTTSLTFLVGLLLFLLIALWAIKHFNRLKAEAGGQQARIQIVDKRMLSQKSCVYLLDVDGKQLLIAEHVNSIQVIDCGKELYPTKE